MKPIILVISLFLLTNCSSQTVKFAEQQGTACLPVKNGETICYPIRDYLDPVRFHKLSDYERNHLPSMPDLN